MRVIRYHSYGGPEVLTIEETDVPQPGPAEVLIRAEAIGVNFVETQRRRGSAPFPTPLPNAPHGDVVGTVVAAGAGVTSVGVGDRVAAPVAGEAYADYAVTDATFLAPIPAGLGLAEASVLASPAQTALCTLKTGQIKPGDTVLVHAASGSIGHLALRLAKVLGAGKVIGTAGSARKLDFAREYGADIAVDYSAPGWADRVRAATDGCGVDVIIDSVGGDVLRQGIGLLAPFGRLVFYGAASGDIPRISPMELIGLQFVTGSSLWAWWQHRPDEVRAGLDQLTGLLASGGLRVSLGTTLALTEAAKAHQLIEERGHIGRVLLIP
ncbi:zinc-binding dehydrogenase [Streptomyces sp. NA02950]|uniref:quinone oxidoreductase family protein n=1 Tax=Streptomyces sp. NA02950 TaxID=2742137 RepID=UPI0015909726|nr:zinc-binding dehydrogenase [Streptomyces sp. NA02950]QKV93069.1 zinc-binding dehydrogenase [Streptomyces sp. NA02950]